ncbi:MAG: family 43 glycosylhydrolase, partial [Planctomycetaceae bacterium]|nr:family 43 glycosylhydrolase [Planctomycetaceae bacterium]
PLITEYGFDASLTNFEGLGPRVLPLCDAHNGKPPRRHDLGSADLGRGPISWEDRSLVTASFVSRTMEFISQAKADGKPFYVNVWPDDVHSPFFPPEVRRGDGSKRQLYHGVLKTMDEQLGILLDSIRNDPELRDNTLVLICSDNGPEEGAGSAGPFRGGKTMLYEGGIRSPLIVWGPGLVNAQQTGQINESSVFAAFDLVPSLLKVCAVTPSQEIAFDGEDLADVILGKSQRSRTSPLFFRRPPDRPGTNGENLPDLAVRAGDWKLLIEYDHSSPQLYDLKTDRGETNNVASAHPNVVEQLSRAVFTWHETLPADAGSMTVGALPPDQFVNPIAEGADPWVIQHNGRYLWCFSDGNRAIALHESASLVTPGPKRIIWSAPEEGPYSREVWAPELHFIDGHFYVYFAASNGQNANHLAYVLKSAGDDPFGEYTVHGPLATGDGTDGRSPNIWAIDMTVLQHNGRLFAIWSGWDAPGTDQQFLYAAPMSDPVTISGPRVLLTPNDEWLWERTEEKEGTRGLHEGPEILKHQGRTFLLYSCAASWLPTYKLGLMELVGDNPLQPSSWQKSDKPVFQSSENTWGVGHSCFVMSPDGREWWHVFHAKRDRRPGWRRGVFVQPFSFSTDGEPQFGAPVAPSVALPVPSGTVGPDQSVDASAGDWDLTTTPLPPLFTLYGHHQRILQDAAGLHLGIDPEDPVNDYRCGEKLLVTDRRFRNGTVSTHVRLEAGDRDAGVMFRVSGASVGYDAQRGYFAGIIPEANRVIVGRMDGSNWHEMARASLSLESGQDYDLTVTFNDAQITVSVDGQTLIETSDATYTEGQVGLRVVNSSAVFRDLRVAAP